MRLVYATTARLPTEMAHSLQIVECCAAHAAAGAEVTLVRAGRRPGPGAGEAIDPRDHYGVPRSFEVETVDCADPGWTSDALRPTALRIRATTFGVRLAVWVRRHAPGAVLYSRDPLPLLVAGLAVPRRLLVYEAHQLPLSRRGRILHRACVRRVALVVGVTERITAAARAAGARRVLLARDGYRQDRFAAQPSRDAARRALGLPPDVFVVGYVGRLRTLGMDKGVGRLAEAAASLADLPLVLAVVGGPDAEVQALRASWRRSGLPGERLVTPGQVPPDEVPHWLAALDVGTLPFPRTPHFADCASPLKLFEYLAAGLPIVASDLPALAEVLVDGESAMLVPAGDGGALAAALRRLFVEPRLRERLAAGARRSAEAYTWAARSERILAAIEELWSP